MPDVAASIAPADVRLWVSLDVHKLSIVAATLPPAGGRPEVSRIETTERAIRRFIDGLGGLEGLAVCYEALALRPKPRPRLAQTHALADELLQPQALGQRRDHQHPGVTDRPLIIKLDLHNVQPIVHHVGDLLGGPQLPNTAAFSLLSRSNYATNRTTSPANRWIQVS